MNIVSGLICRQDYHLLIGTGRDLYVPIFTFFLTRQFTDAAIDVIREQLRDPVDFSWRATFSSRQEYSKHKITINLSTGYNISNEVIEI